MIFGNADLPFTSMVALPNNIGFSPTGTPYANGASGTAAPLPAGTYVFHGNYMLKAQPGVNIYNYHVDIGTDPNNIDTAPGGGSTNGHHVPIPGDPNAVTFCEPCGSRILTLDGNTHVYLRVVAAYDTGATVTIGAHLLWHQVA